MEKKGNKLIKKIIVNSITFVRVLGTFAMPFFVSFLSPIQFLLLIGSILLTDFVDGQLARKMNVSTTFGSLLDMGADKLFGIALMLVLSFTYPVMAIPLALELGIAHINTQSVLRGNKAESSIIGKGKMWVVGLSMTSLLMIGASPDISQFLSSININPNGLFPLAREKVLEWLKMTFDFISTNKEMIKNITIPATIISEAATLVDYKKDYEKVKNNERKKLLDELKRYKEYVSNYGFNDYVSDIMFNEEYYEKTKDDALIKKLMPTKNKVVDK